MANIPQYEISPEELELIEAYLNQTLDANSKQQFEERMRTEETFPLKVAEVRQLLAGLDEAALQSKLPSFHAALEQERATVPIRTIPLYRHWWAAASILLVIASATWLLWPKGNRDEQLYKAYFTPDIGLPVAMGSADSTSYKFYDGMVSYKEEKYAEALAKWKPLAISANNTDTLRYYIGMALLNQGQHKEAAEQLALLADIGNSSFREDAIWYLALVHLKNGERAQAIFRLKELPNREEAKKLLAELEH